MSPDPFIKKLIAAVGKDGLSAIEILFDEQPELPTLILRDGATRQNPKDFFFDRFMHYVYAGDTALHVAAMAYRSDIVELLVKRGADVGARNRRGAQPLHYACDGGPQASFWNPEKQYALVSTLVKLGADINALDKSGVAPLHRSIRNRCTGAVRALIDHGADVNLLNASGSSAMKLAGLTTGKSGSGSDESKREQQAILILLKNAGAK